MELFTLRCRDWLRSSWNTNWSQPSMCLLTSVEMHALVNVVCVFVVS